MAVTIDYRPKGQILSTQLTFVNSFDTGGDIAFTTSSHGFLFNGTELVFISCDVSEYSGFFLVSAGTPTQFAIVRPGETERVRFIKTVTSATIYKTINHNWSCVHLPIVYTLISDKWPTNSVDTVRTISSVANNNGFCKLTVSGAIKASGIPDHLDFVEIQTGTLAGVYQIVELISNTIFTIKLAYSSANATALSSQNIQYYYNNYKVRVKVWAGVNAWASIKPYEAIVELDLTPDENNIVDININEYLKDKIKVISNNLQLATLPNDIDSFTQFFIETTETYDQSDYGDLLTTYVAPYTSDQLSFQGVAVNSMLQFKNRYSGYLSEYLDSGSNGKFLTLFDEPRYFIGCYYDLNFLTESKFVIKLESYLSSILQSTTYETLAISEPAVYRKEISLFSGAVEDRLDFTILGAEVWTNGRATSATFLFDTLTLNLGESASIGAGDFDAMYIAVSGFGASDAVVMYAYVNCSDLSGSVTLNYTLYNSTKSSSANITSIPITANGFYQLSKVATSFVPAFAEIIIDNGTAGTVTSWSVEALYSDKNITINVDSECSFQDIYLTWKNYLGGMDYWKFTAQKDYIADIENTTETTENIYPTWPNSYGEFADTIDKETSRISRDKIVVRSQNMTESEMNAVRYIVSSPLVQILVSKSDRRTVKVSKGSFTWKRDEDKLYSIEFEISYTNTIPSQSL